MFQLLGLWAFVSPVLAKPGDHPRQEDVFKLAIPSSIVVDNDSPKREWILLEDQGSAKIRRQHGATSLYWAVPPSTGVARQVVFVRTFQEGRPLVLFRNNVQKEDGADLKALTLPHDDKITVDNYRSIHSSSSLKNESPWIRWHRLEFWQHSVLAPDPDSFSTLNRALHQLRDQKPGTERILYLKSLRTKPSWVRFSLNIESGKPLEIHCAYGPELKQKPYVYFFKLNVKD
ncbi:MAG: hypothetical protein HC904_00050 [Blastochloris sp.]|nr:hypothetical protein [Blastochloris sp.]